MSEKYYNAKTKTLAFPYDFNDKLKDLPVDTQNIIFEEIDNNKEYLKFNQKVDATRKNKFFTGAPKNNIIFDGDNLPTSLTHLTFGRYFN